MFERIGSLLAALAVAFGFSAATPAEDPAHAIREAAECTPRGGLGNFFAKLEAGQPVKIAYLGGSITAQQGWRVLSREWFQKRYPKSKVGEIHAAIGGTGSDLGVFRMEHDALSGKPDLLFVEFAVNDRGAKPEQIVRSMEGIVRKTWQADPATDICFVYTLHEADLPALEAGKANQAASVMEEVADHYGIPTIHMALEAARLTAQGKVVFKAAQPKTDAEKAALGGKILFSPDGVHPYTDSGHGLYMAAIERSMPAIEAAGKAGAHALPGAMRADNWENARMTGLDEATLSGGWVRLDAKNPLAGKFGNRLPGIWKAEKPGETVSFRFKGTACMIYDIVGPDCGVVSVSVDGKPATKAARFDMYCTYHRLQRLPVASGLADGVHTVRIETLGDALDKAEILKKKNNTMKNPKDYEGTTWYAGGILLLGEIVK